MLPPLILIVFLVFIDSIQCSLNSKSHLIHGEQIGGFNLQTGKSIRSSPEFPYMAEIEYMEIHWCGGAIIKKNAVLTAAHCVHGRKPENYMVKVGHLYRNSNTAPGLQKRTVENFILHPHYVKTINQKKDDIIYNDLAILVLKEPLQFTEFVNKIKIPLKKDEDKFADKNAVILGWGKTERDEFSSILLKINVVVLNGKDCDMQVNDYHRSYLCTIGVKKKGAVCGGDSGGPVAIHNKNNPQEDILLGINSFAYEKQDPKLSFIKYCDENSPSVSMNIAFYSEWILGVLKILKKN